MGVCSRVVDDFVFCRRERKDDVLDIKDNSEVEVVKWDLNVEQGHKGPKFKTQLRGR